MKKHCSVLCLLIQCVFTRGQSLSHPHIDVSLHQGDATQLPNTLEVNCSFQLGNASDVSALISLSVARANVSDQRSFIELANINDYSNGKVNLFVQENVNATGMFNHNGVSFLHLHWAYATASQSGVYECSALVFNLHGQPVAMTESATVSVALPGIDDCLNSIQEMRTHVQNLEQELLELRQNYSQLQAYATNLERNISQSDCTSMPAVFEDSMTYGNHRYYISKIPFTSIENSTSVCENHGGYMVIINNTGEYNAIQTFLQSPSKMNISSVYISGIDELVKDMWLLPPTNEPMPFQDWASAEPGYYGGLPKCVAMYRERRWQMVTSDCNSWGPTDHRFLCEMP